MRLVWLTSDVSRAFQRRSQHWGNLDGVTFLVGAVAAVAVIWLLILGCDWASRHWKPRRNNPQELFFNLCDAHRLSRGERQLLCRVASRLAQPASVFVDPALLQAMGQKAGMAEKHLQALEQRLFQGLNG